MTLRKRDSVRVGLSLAQAELVLTISSNRTLDIESMALGDTNVDLLLRILGHVYGIDDAVFEEKNVVDNDEISLIHPLLLKLRVLRHGICPCFVTRAAVLNCYKISFLLINDFLELM
ncbi:gpalpp motifs-containing protein 1 [Plakobranchus ocellatus]|uniref:Gpalpp motifs-containing protein 1 n=1 Tax=Plakobranchus ocellatus TaxID=259542 RepID=A0AAV3WTY1_9GAST|nr:gpalpp motifs-containing protein 1 [Plakobranchus ocellatus]